MPEALKLSILVVAFVYGILCISRPIWILQIIIRWTKFAARGAIENDYVQEAIDLMEKDPSQYAITYDTQVSKIRRTGYIALTVSIIGFCLALTPG
jgi:hypothetical protein